MTFFDRRAGLGGLPWAGLIVAFLVAGIAASRAYFLPGITPPRGPYATTDRMFAEVLGAGAVSRGIEEAAAEIPTDAGILVVGPGHDWAFVEVYYALSYLLWPRHVWALGMADHRTSPPYRWMPPHEFRPAAIFFYRSAPPKDMASSARVITEGLVMVPTPGKETP